MQGSYGKAISTKLWIRLSDRLADFNGVPGGSSLRTGAYEVEGDGEEAKDIGVEIV